MDCSRASSLLPKAPLGAVTHRRVAAARRWMENDQLPGRHGYQGLQPWLHSLSTVGYTDNVRNLLTKCVKHRYVPGIWVKHLGITSARGRVGASLLAKGRAWTVREQARSYPKLHWELLRTGEWPLRDVGWKTTNSMDATGINASSLGCTGYPQLATQYLCAMHSPST
ncbi:hypothetical protein D9M71_521080 [compost metagenome]